MSAMPQEDVPLSIPDTAAPRLSRRTLLTGAGGVAGGALLGGAWYVWHGRQPLHTLSGHTSGVNCVAFSPDGMTLADASLDGTVRLWRVSDGTLLRTLKTVNISQFQAVAFSPNGERVMAGASSENNEIGGVIYQWQVSDGAQVGKITKANDPSPASPNGATFPAIYDVAYAPDGALIASGNFSGYVYLWRASDGQFVRKMKDPQIDITSDANRVAFSPDGQILAAGMKDGTGRRSQSVLLWRVSDGTLIRDLHVYGTEVTGVSFSPDGKNLLTGAESPSLGGRVVTDLWRVSDGDHMGTWDGLGRAAIFGPDGQTFAAAQGRHVQVRRLDREAVHSITADAESVVSIAFSPDGRLLATAASNRPRDPGTVQIWRLH